MSGIVACPNCGQTVTRTFCAACGTRVDSGVLADRDGRVGQGQDIATFAPRGEFPGRPRRQGWVPWAMVIAALCVAVIIFVAVVSSRSEDTGRGGGRQVAAPDRQAPATMRPAPSSAPSTVPSTASVSTPSTAVASAPVAVVVSVDCGGRQCALAIRESPSVSARQTGSVADAQVVYVSCVAKGGLVNDADGQGTSMDWLRLADGSGYFSAIYARGPQVRSC